MYANRNYKVVLLIVAFIVVSTLPISAQRRVWSENSQDKSNIVTDKSVARDSFPKEFKLFNLSIEPLRQ